MNHLDIAGFRAHALGAPFGRRLQEAQRSIRHALSLIGPDDPPPYISLSCGKDSSAMAKLVLEELPSAHIRIATAPETRFLHRNIDDCIAFWRRSYPEATITEIEYRVDEAGEGLDPLDNNGPRMVAALAAAAPYSLCFVGVRGAESRTRRFATRYFRDDARWPIYTYRADGDPRQGTRRVFPLENWITDDVWALLVKHGIPVLEQYEEGAEERTTLRLTKESIETGVVAKLRRRDPEGYRKLTEMNPDIRRLT